MLSTFEKILEIKYTFKSWLRSGLFELPTLLVDALNTYLAARRGYKTVVVAVAISQRLDAVRIANFELLALQAHPASTRKIFPQWKPVCLRSLRY